MTHLNSVPSTEELMMLHKTLDIVSYLEQPNMGLETLLVGKTIIESNMKSIGVNVKDYFNLDIYTKHLNETSYGNEGFVQSISDAIQNFIKYIKKLIIDALEWINKDFSYIYNRLFRGGLKTITINNIKDDIKECKEAIDNPLPVTIDIPTLTKNIPNFKYPDDIYKHWPINEADIIKYYYLLQKEDKEIAIINRFLSTGTGKPMANIVMFQDIEKAIATAIVEISNAIRLILTEIEFDRSINYSDSFNPSKEIIKVLNITDEEMDENKYSLLYTKYVKYLHKVMYTAFKPIITNKDYKIAYNTSTLPNGQIVTSFIAPSSVLTFAIHSKDDAEIHEDTVIFKPRANDITDNKVSIDLDKLKLINIVRIAKSDELDEYIIPSIMNYAKIIEQKGILLDGKTIENENKIIATDITRILKGYENGVKKSTVKYYQVSEADVTLILKLISKIQLSLNELNTGYQWALNNRISCGELCYSFMKDYVKNMKFIKQ